MDSTERAPARKSPHPSVRSESSESSSFHIRSGRTDGCGKTTILRLINGLSDLSAASAGKTCLFPSQSSTNAAYQVYSHTVVFGDTIEKLCEAYQIRYADVRSLLQGLNPASSLAALRIGEEILLVSPAVSSAVAVPAASSVPASASSQGYPFVTHYPVSTSYPVSTPAFPEAVPEITITVK